jgi:hypothetical protein
MLDANSGNRLIRKRKIPPTVPFNYIRAALVQIKIYEPLQRKWTAGDVYPYISKGEQ